MNELERRIRRSKKHYDSIETPDELQSVVSSAVRAAKRNQRAANRMTGKRFAAGIAAAVAVFLCFTAGLNTSQAFAAAVMDIPVIGTVSKFLTFRTYDYQDEDKVIHEVIPQLQETGGSKEAGSLEEKINEEINKTMNQYREDAQNRIEEYKEAFLATGGTEEEFAGKGIRVEADYKIYYESDDMLSFVITANENWCGAYGVRLYYNLNLKEEKRISLKDLLGENYVELANASIKEQMKARMEADENLIYWGEDMNGFTTIDDSTDFYINENGNPVIVFDKYEVAPGAFGIQEFEITRS